ncbi:MAG: hypothetical protein JST98_12380 [Bacteroidetes bacterium]|nr:hypothetical protein [Bacteroidota bacterium]MBS1945959.1 hypothetical protein [Bacteroidota bacterium]
MRRSEMSVSAKPCHAKEMTIITTALSSQGAKILRFNNIIFRIACTPQN